MSTWSRIVNMLRGDRLNRDIDEELNSHIEAAVEQGRDPVEAQRAFGSALRLREASRDVRVVAWLDSLRADTVFGWRQLCKRKVTSAAAILSLGLAFGACTSAFRLIDALLLRPLPVADPDRLYALFRQGFDGEGKPRTDDSYEYPLFQQMRASVKGQAELIAISYAVQTELTYGSDEQIEKAKKQYVSGWMFNSLGIQPALGRLFNENDDLKPRAHPYAVLSYDYWTRRFGRDPAVIGRSFRMNGDLFEIIGVAEERFTGTEPGTVAAVFIPTMMFAGVTHPDWSWLRVFVRPNAGVAAQPVRDRLRATYRAYNQERIKALNRMPKAFLDRFFRQTLLLEPASAGVSDMQKDNARPLTALSVLVGLVLLIACTNIANLMTAQAAARSREMALRVSIGAGRWRLVQLVLVESGLLAFFAAAIGAGFAWWSAPFVVSRINPPDNPARLFLPLDWRIFAFGLALTLGVTFLFGLIPALRASSVRPASALKGGEDPHSRRRLMHGLIAAQVAFCFVVHFVSGMFVVTFDRLVNQPIGFSAERILTLELQARTPQEPIIWNQLLHQVRTVPGVEAAALAGFPLLSGDGWNGLVSFNGATPSADLACFLSVSPGWLETMKVPILQGRDFRETDTFPGMAIVNEAFARLYFKNEQAVGRWFERAEPEGARARLQIVGMVRDARYRDLREPIRPTAYVPVRPAGDLTLIVRTSASDPLQLAPVLRHEVPKARPEFRVTDIRTQAEIIQSQTVRERLIAMLALFFALVALLLAGIGLYGVLDYSVLQRRREIGIRMAIGAQAFDIARRVTADVFTMVLVGSLAGLALGMASARYIEALLYHVKPTDAGLLAVPALTIVAAALLAAVPAVLHAVRIDPVNTLRAE